VCWLVESYGQYKYRPWKYCDGGTNSLFGCMTFPMRSKKMDTKKMSTAMLLKKQITSHYPSSILLKRPLKWHQNVQNFAVKPFTCSSIVDKSTVWPWKTVDGLLNHVEMYSTSQMEANNIVQSTEKKLVQWILMSSF